MFAPLACKTWKDVDAKAREKFHERILKRSEQNSENRAQLPVNHRGGSKPFVRYREEQRDAETNQECGRIELYRITHFSESKGWINSTAEKNYVSIFTLSM
ncbi:hypothetical protein ACHQM5_001809 [Ranunculus cassubicifolius]